MVLVTLTHLPFSEALNEAASHLVRLHGINWHMATWVWQPPFSKSLRSSAAKAESLL